MSRDELDAIIEASLLGTQAPNGIHDMPDIFWLMGWADWSIEKQIDAGTGADGLGWASSR